MKKKYGIEKCKCGRCKQYWLTGIGNFVQGSGFTKEEAKRIAQLLNDHEPLVLVSTRR